jgi:hypothetical protein
MPAKLLRSDRLRQMTELRSGGVTFREIGERFGVSPSRARQLVGHVPAPRLSEADRFWSKVDRTAGPDSCWLWTASKFRDGYGQFRLDGHGRNVSAHRYAYELLVGPVPEGLHLDHVRARGCTSRACVNPAHLEPVTCRENLMRGSGFAAVNAGKTHCAHGHKFSLENTYFRPKGGRACRACRREAEVEQVGGEG